MRPRTIFSDDPETKARRFRGSHWQSRRPKNSHHESGGGTMDLKESKFYYAGHDMNFAVFSDYPCRVKYVDSIRLPIDVAAVEIYTIEPASNGQWVVAEQWNEGESS